MGRRWTHSEGVARQAERLGALVSGEDREVLVAAAYLHDVGYAPALVDTGFHPIDGGRHLRTLAHERLAALVAYHSAALEEARLRGLGAELAEFSEERSLVADILTFCDLTTGPDGQRLTPTERLDEVVRRYGPDDLVSRAVRDAEPRLMRTVARVEAKLGEADRVAIVDDLAEALPGLIDRGTIVGPHAVYYLGPPIELPTPLKNGSKYRATHAEVMIDLLFTSETLKAAVAASRQRRDAAGGSPEPQ